MERHLASSITIAIFMWPCATPRARPILSINEASNSRSRTFPCVMDLSKRPAIKARVIDTTSKLTQFDEMREWQLQLNTHASKCSFPGGKLPFYYIKGGALAS